MREIHTGLFEHSAAGHDPAFAATSGIALPRVVLEGRFTVECLEFGADAILQRQQEFYGLFDLAHGSPLVS